MTTYSTTVENSALKVCGTKKDIEINNDKRCPCDGYFRPDVLLYEESPDKVNMNEVYSLIKRRPTHFVIIAYMKSAITLFAHFHQES